MHLNKFNVCLSDDHPFFYLNYFPINILQLFNVWVRHCQFLYEDKGSLWAICPCNFTINY